MRILADSNVFIDFWNAAPYSKELEEFTKIFSDNDIVVCGIVRAELLHGAYSDKNRYEIHEVFRLFDMLNLDDSDWETLGDQLYLFRRQGVTIPFSDAVIASIAMKYDIPIWTNDNHYKLMQTVMAEMRVISTTELLG